MTLDEDLAKRIAEDAVLARVLAKADSGTADFTDTSRYHDRMAEIVGAVMREHVLEVPAESRSALCERVLRGRYRDSAELLSRVQEALDASLGIRLAPQIPEFQTERVRKIGNSLTDQTVSDETIQRRAESASANVVRAFQDRYVQENVRFRSDAGLKCWIVRDAGAKCCDWCAGIDGKYEYGSEPKDVYGRHDNCTCTVTYENGRKRQDVWSKRTWEQPEPGAGAGEAVRFSAENGPGGAGEAVRLRAGDAPENALRRLTNDVPHDILESIELFPVSSIMSEEQRKTLDEALAPIPGRLLEELAGFVSSIQIVDSRGFSSFNRRTREIILDRETAAETIVHELGHAFGDMLGLYDNHRFLEIISRGLDLSNGGDITPYQSPVNRNETIYIYTGIGSEKFMSLYQGRVYGDALDWKSPLDPKFFLEYISVGFDAYFNFQEELKTSDSALYLFLEEIIHGYLDSEAAEAN